jgi:hypothetical protein
MKPGLSQGSTYFAFDLTAVAGKNHLRDAGVVLRELYDFPHCNPAGPRNREPEYPATDSREGNGRDPVFDRQLQAFPVTGRQIGILVAVASMPDRANCMDDIFCRQLVSPGYFGKTGFAATQVSAFVQKRFACRAVNGAVYATATAQ